MKTGTLYPDDPDHPGDPESTIKTLKDQLQQVVRLARIFEFRYKMELSDLSTYPISEKNLGVED